MFADNVWSLPGDINDNFSAFPRAMKIAEGTICVIDTNCKILKHLWSLMDIYLAVQRKKYGKSGAYKLDFYTTIVTNQLKAAVGLTDGLIENDFNSLVKKSDREAKFPLEIIKEAFKVNVKSADYDGDKYIQRFVMNAITGIPRNDEHTKDDKKYDDFNKILGGIFVSSSLDRLLRENPSDAELYRYLEALNAYAPTSISLDLSNSNHHLIIRKKIIKVVFESLPSSIERVHINLTIDKCTSTHFSSIFNLDGIFNPVKNELFNFINKLKKLKALRIYGVDLVATEVKNMLNEDHKSITSLALVDCSITDNEMKEIMAEIQQCQCLEELDLSENPFSVEGLRHIDDMLVNCSRTIKLRLFNKDTKKLNNFETIKQSFKKIMPYHFSSVSILHYFLFIL